MKIYIKKDPASEYAELSVKAGATIEEILKDEALLAGAGIILPYRIYAARVKGKAVRLDTPAEEGSHIIFLDMRDPSGKMCYQNSITAMFIKAAKTVLPGARVRICNSINRGIYTQFEGAASVTQKTANAIEAEMRRMSKAKLPISSVTDEKWLLVPNTDYIRNFDLHEFHGGIVIRIPQDTNPEGLPVYIEDEKLYQAFSVENRWRDTLGIETLDDLNAANARGEMKEIMLMCEALMEKHIAEMAETIAACKKRVVLIAGPSSSGKTSFAKRLCTQLKVAGKKPLYLGTDDYFLSRDKTPVGPDGTKDFENLGALDLPLFNNQLSALLSGETVDIPRFDFISGEPVFGERIVRGSEDHIFVIEGIHALNDELTPLIPKKDKFRIYISPLSSLPIDDTHRIHLTDIRKLRRIVRDSTKRGWDARTTISAWPFVRAGEEKNIFPYTGGADMIFNSSFVYELGVFRHYAAPMLSCIPEDDECYCEAQRLLRLVSFADEIADTDPIPNNSIIREFIGGSILA